MKELFFISTSLHISPGKPKCRKRHFNVKYFTHLIIRKSFILQKIYENLFVKGDL